MRLALTHAYGWPEVRRGAERIVHELSRSLARRGNEVTVFTSGSVPGRTEDAGVTTIRLRRRFGDANRHEAHFAAWLVPQLAARRFDAVHSLGPRDALSSIRAARLRGRRAHRTVYTNLGNPVRSWWQSRPDGRAHARVVRDVDVYGCMSRYSLRVLEEDWGRRGVLSPGGVNLNQFVPVASRTEDPTILFSGALDEPRKGAALLVEACGLLSRDEPRLRLWLSGPGDATKLIAEAPERLRGCLEPLPIGAPEAQAERYGRAWVTALPSKGDSFGMVLIESLACGTPIVVTDDSALPELVSPGRTGAICEPDDPESLAQGLQRGLELSRQPGIVEACRSSAGPYDWDTAIASYYEGVYADASGDS